MSPQKDLEVLEMLERMVPFPLPRCCELLFIPLILQQLHCNLWVGAYDRGRCESLSDFTICCLMHHAALCNQAPC